MATMRTGALGRIPDCQLHRRVIREKVRAATGNGGTQKGTFAHQRSESVTFARTRTGETGAQKGSFMFQTRDRRLGKR